MKTKWNEVMQWVVACSVAAGLVGCETGGNDSDGTTWDATPAVAPVTNAAPQAAVAAAPAPTPASLDQLDISGAKSLGTHADVEARNAAITRLLYSADIQGGNVALSFDKLNWPVQHGKKPIDGSVQIFWVEGGRVIGGYFDAHAVGQTSKTLANISGGYLGGHKPAKGQTVYFAIVSNDGRQRTNVQRSPTPW